MVHYPKDARRERSEGRLHTVDSGRITGVWVNQRYVFLLKSEATIEIFAMVMLAALMKFIATAFAGYFLCDILFKDSLLLGLMRNIKGPYDMLLLNHCILIQAIDRHAFTVLALSNILLTAMVTPWIDIFYNPHMRVSVATGKNSASFLNTPSNVELRVLCCIETEKNVPSIISLLEATNPTKASPVCAYVVHLNELVALAPPVMLPYYGKTGQVASKGSSSIMHAFENYSKNSRGLVSVRQYTVVAAHKSMHEYVCRLALQEFIPLVIIPFQANQYTDTIEMTTMRIVNNNM
ncbi:hypothetical protein MLD38_002695 [Melastoma candidum]|uniref:Uncharacterized protein n=1 Tax=Melastoma candidum TaxID=119954 RepID=A0ACB9RZL2_9MYRT|nr:hypothetical protein MLD38_002695 [Melastoma candidum]